jgi:molybdopterin synthase sulfur carrier subunit
MSTVRYFAAAKDAAGTGLEQVPGSTLAEALTTARLLHGDRFTTVLARCSLVVDGSPVGGRDHATVALTPSSVVDVLPPFAGG